MEKQSLALKLWFGRHNVSGKMIYSANFMFQSQKQLQNMAKRTWSVGHWSQAVYKTNIPVGRRANSLSGDGTDYKRELSFYALSCHKCTTVDEGGAEQQACR